MNDEIVSNLEFAQILLEVTGNLTAGSEFYCGPGGR